MQAQPWMWQTSHCSRWSLRPSATCCRCTPSPAPLHAHRSLGIVRMRCWPWCGHGLTLRLQICTEAMAWQLSVKALPRLCSPCAGDSQLSRIRSLFLHELLFSPFSISEPTRQSKFPLFIPFPHKPTSQTHAGSSSLSWTDSHFPRHRQDTVGWLWDQSGNALQHSSSTTEEKASECYCILGLSVTRPTGSDTASLARNS